MSLNNNVTSTYTQWLKTFVLRHCDSRVKFDILHGDISSLYVVFFRLKNDAFTHKLTTNRQNKQPVHNPYFSKQNVKF